MEDGFGNLLDFIFLQVLCARYNFGRNFHADISSILSENRNWSIREKYGWKTNFQNKFQVPCMGFLFLSKEVSIPAPDWPRKMFFILFSRSPKHSNFRYFRVFCECAGFVSHMCWNVQFHSAYSANGHSFIPLIPRLSAVQTLLKDLFVILCILRYVHRVSFCIFRECSQFHSEYSVASQWHYLKKQYERVTTGSMTIEINTLLNLALKKLFPHILRIWGI